MGSETSVEDRVENVSMCDLVVHVQAIWQHSRQGRELYRDRAGALNGSRTRGCMFNGRRGSSLTALRHGNHGLYSERGIGGSSGAIVQVERGVREARLAGGTQSGLGVRVGECKGAHKSTSNGHDNVPYPTLECRESCPQK